MFHYHAINKIAIEIGPFFGYGPLKVHWYGIMYLVAFAAAWWLGRVRASKPGSTWKAADIDDFMFFGMLGTILGGRLGYVLFYGLKFWTAEDKWYPLKVWDGGMSFHGGLLGVLIAFAIFAMRRQRRIADVFDFAAPLPGIGICAVRIGNFINGELWGKPTDVPWGFMVDGTVRHATHRRYLLWRRQIGDDGIQQRLDPAVAVRRTAQHHHAGTGQRQVPQCGSQRLRRHR